jgi:CheY-like chemotaxis protein
VVQDITKTKLTEQTRREQTEALRTIYEVGQVISAELDLHKIVQAVTDAATELTGAQFGSFFYNMPKEDGGSYMLYAIAGAPREAFCKLPAIALTAYARVEDRMRALKAGYQMHVPKPVELAAAVASVAKRDHQ